MSDAVTPIPVIRDLETARKRLTRTGSFAAPTLSAGAQSRIRELFGQELTATEAVDRILDQVRVGGDSALRDLSLRIDGSNLDRIEVPRDQWLRAKAAIDPTLVAAMELAREQIWRFHEQQKRTSWLDFSEEGVLGQIVRPLERIGVYAPGGSAVYPSSLLMTAVPARVAGVEEIVVCTPPTAGQVSPLLLAAAEIAGVDRVFALGGAQAIGAMAFGTESVPHVDKIFGPGNIFVVLAKQRVFGTVAIDQLPGPTETLVIADRTTSPHLVAADMLAQAEHDPMASAVLLTDSEDLARRVVAEIAEQMLTLPRREIVEQSLANNSLIAVVPSLDIAVELANAFAPEHMCLLVSDPWEIAPLIRNAGGIFMGENSPEALGDYTAGPSHVMPTGGSARHFSPLNLGDFTKVISVIGANRNALERLGPATIALAKAEGLDAHARAIEFRLDLD